MPSRRLLELLLGTGVPGRPGEPARIAGLSDDVLAMLVRRSLSAGFGDVLDDGDMSALLSSLDSYDPDEQITGTTEKSALFQAVYDLFTGQTPRNAMPYGEFEPRFMQFVSSLSNSLQYATVPRLMDMPCREFGELDLDELSKMQVPGELSGYMASLGTYFEGLGAITKADAEHVSELIEKMASAPGYLRFLSKEKKYQEVARLLGIVRDMRSSGIMSGPSADDMMVSLGLLLFNVSPSEKIASYLASLRPSRSSNALLYHYHAILALNYMLTGRLYLASVNAARALLTTKDHGMMAYVSILMGCIAIRQGDYDRAIGLLERASAMAPAGRMRGLISFYRGVIFYEKQEYASAIKCFHSAGTSVTDPLDQVTVHNNIGSCHMHLGDVTQAEQEFTAMEKLSDSLKGDHVRRCRLTAISYLGAISRARGDNDRAIERYEYALKLAVSSNDKQAIANQLGNLGTTYASAGDMAKALQFLNACMAYSERMSYWEGIRFAYWHICHTLVENGHRAEADRFSETYSSRYPELKNLYYSHS